MKQPIFQHKIDTSKSYDPNVNVAMTFKRFGFVPPAEAALSGALLNEKRAQKKRQKRATTKR